MANVQPRSALGPILGLVSERVIPGGSLLLQGRLGEGLAHTALGIAAQAFFGFPGLLFVSANSFARSQTGENVYDLVTDADTSTAPTPRPNKT